MRWWSKANSWSLYFPRRFSFLDEWLCDTKLHISRTNPVQAAAPRSREADATTPRRVTAPVQAVTDISNTPETAAPQRADRQRAPGPRDPRKLSLDQQRILAYMLQHGNRPMTEAQVYGAVTLSDKKPRLRDMARAGLFKASGQSRIHRGARVRHGALRACRAS